MNSLEVSGQANTKVVGKTWVYTDKQKAADHIKKAKDPVRHLERKIMNIREHVDGESEHVDIKWW